LLRRFTLLIILGALLAGCGKATLWPGHGPEGGSAQGTTPAAPVQTPSQPGKTTSPASPGQGSAAPDGTIPGNSKALEAALSSPATLSYKIEIVNEPVADPAKYLDDRLAKGAPGANELLFVLFAGNNWNLHFGLGAMNPPLGADQVYAQVKALYQPKAKAGDPAGGLADLVNGLNHR
jgi:hypothetical protein